MPKPKSKSRRCAAELSARILLHEKAGSARVAVLGQLLKDKHINKGGKIDKLFDLRLVAPHDRLVAAGEIVADELQILIARNVALDHDLHRAVQIPAGSGTVAVDVEVGIVIVVAPEIEFEEIALVGGIGRVVDLHAVVCRLHKLADHIHSSVFLVDEELDPRAFGNVAHGSPAASQIPDEIVA